MRNASAAIAIIGIWLGVGLTGYFSPANIEVIAFLAMISTIATAGRLSK